MQSSIRQCDDPCTITEEEDALCDSYRILRQSADQKLKEQQQQQKKKNTY